MTSPSQTNPPRPREPEGPPAGRAAREPLSRERVVAAALVIIDLNGLEGLSMRRLAGELGVEAMSLYHHVDDKADVLDGVVSTVLDEITLPLDGSWQGRAMHVVREMRRVVKAHPNVHTLVVERGLRSPSAVAPATALLDALGEGGMTGRRLVSAFWTLLSYASGALSCELSETPDLTGDETRLPPFLFEGDPDEWFEHGLTTVTNALSA